MSTNITFKNVAAPKFVDAVIISDRLYFDVSDAMSDYVITVEGALVTIKECNTARYATFKVPVDTKATQCIYVNGCAEDAKLRRRNADEKYAILPCVFFGNDNHPMWLTMAEETFSRVCDIAYAHGVLHKDLRRDDWTINLNSFAPQYEVIATGFHNTDNGWQFTLNLHGDNYVVAGNLNSTVTLPDDLFYTMNDDDVKFIRALMDSELWLTNNSAIVIPDKD